LRRERNPQYGGAGGYGSAELVVIGRIPGGVHTPPICMNIKTNGL
jgi:hypothetical protein